MAVGADGDRVFVAGGWTGGGATDDVWIGEADAGDIAWSDGTPLPGDVEHAASGVAGGMMWVVGGDDTSGALLDSVSSAPVTAKGLGDWVTAQPLDAPLTFATGASDGASLWIVGGLPSFGGAAVADVWRLEPGDDGNYTLTAQTPLPAGRFGAAATVADGHLVVVGGAPSFAEDAANNPASTPKPPSPRPTTAPKSAN